MQSKLNIQSIHSIDMQTTQKQIDELIQEINSQSNDVIIRFLTMYDTPDDFRGHVKDYLIDQALVNKGMITQDEANERYNKANPETFEEFVARMEKESN